jgi:hypothetical protein
MSQDSQPGRRLGPDASLAILRQLFVIGAGIVLQCKICFRHKDLAPRFLFLSFLVTLKQKDEILAR